MPEEKRNHICQREAKGTRLALRTESFPFTAAVRYTFKVNFTCQHMYLQTFRFALNPGSLNTLLHLSGSSVIFLPFPLFNLSFGTHIKHHFLNPSLISWNSLPKSSSHQNCGEIKFSCLNHPVCCTLLWHP